MSLAYLVIVLPDGRRAWYTGSDTRFDRFRQPIQVPLFDDENAKQVSLDFALDARERWRDYCKQQLGGEIHILLEKYGPFFDDRPLSSADQTDRRVRCFVPFTNGLGLIASPGHTPEGQKWFVRPEDVPSLVADGRHTALESVYAESPEGAAQRAVDLWGQQILFPDPEAAAREEQRRQQIEQEKLYVPGLRPGDR